MTTSAGPYREPPAQLPCVLICAGLDPSGGAGLIADARVVAQCGARPVGVVTALTVQNTTGVIGGGPLDPEMVGDQLAFLLSDVEVRAVKVGMIGSSDLGRAIAEALQLTNAPLVWDPVMYPSRGDLPMATAAFSEALELFRGHLTLLTPNAHELSYFAGTEITTLDAALVAGLKLAAKLDAAVLVKGGHLDGDDAVDLLIRGTDVDELRARRFAGGEHVHGTGCALSSAIAAKLALGADLLTACRDAKAYVGDRIASAVTPGRGASAVL